MTLRAVSLFSGAGGLDLGLQGAGFEVRARVEFDPYCCETLRAARDREGSNTLIVERDIREVEPSSLLETLQLQPGELDLLAGGPPCQAFSQIGKQKSLGDARGLLLFQMVRFAKILRPRAILIEQVKGLLNAKDAQGQAGGVLRALLQDLRALGYAVQYQALNAAEYETPQLRQRVFIVGVQPPAEFVFPEPTRAAPRRKTAKINSSSAHLPPFKTVRDALDGLGAPDPKGSDRDDSHIDITPAGDRRRIAGVPEGEFLAAQLHLPAEQRGRLTRKDTTKFRRLAFDLPSNTLRCGEIFFHPTENRYLTPREHLRLHGFPDDYLLKGKMRGRTGRALKMDQHRQVANSVPPPLARALGEALARALHQQNAPAGATLEPHLPKG
jgi:DNA (cytosine-5)-methyltransferase 1